MFDVPRTGLLLVAVNKMLWRVELVWFLLVNVSNG